MRCSVMLFVTLVGCGFGGRAGTDGDDVVAPDSDGGDGGDDANPMPDGTGPCVTYSLLFDTCSLTHGGPLIFNGDYTFNTSSREFTVTSGDAVDITSVQLQTADGPVGAILAQSVTFSPNARLRVEGELPFVLLAGDSAAFATDARIEASRGGAGARAICTAPAGTGNDDSSGASGGGGGAFGAAGGPGGESNSDDGPTGGGAAGGLESRPSAIRGGCPGARGGRGSGAGGTGGVGGGAVYVAARDAITLVDAARIEANGAGGGSTIADDGGGGGGSGGMIFLEARDIRANVLVANGGGGSKGGTTQADGQAGQDGQVGTMPAAGGAVGHVNGSNGGVGGALESPAGGNPAGAEKGGGGGGGGSVGYIRLRGATTLGATISPAAETEPAE